MLSVTSAGSELNPGAAGEQQAQWLLLPLFPQALEL